MKGGKKIEGAHNEVFKNKQAPLYVFLCDMANVNLFPFAVGLHYCAFVLYCCIASIAQISMLSFVRPLVYHKRLLGQMFVVVA